MRAVAYCRFSSDMQRDGFSIEAQLSAIREYCVHEGITLVDEYIDEARSGTNAERASFQRMISNSRSHTFDLVIVHKLDRFSRDRYDFAVYKKLLADQGVSVRSVVERLDDSPESIILEGMLESMAEYYSKNLARETMKGLRARARQGLACSNRPFGYDIVDGRFAINESGALIVREIFSRVISGETLASISRDLEARGIRGNRGAAFSYTSIQKIIRNTIYYGTYTFAGEVVSDNASAPIVDIDTWALANSKLNTHKNVAYRRHRVDDYVLTGLLYCGLCGGHYSGHCSHKGKYLYKRYRCTNSTKGSCSASVVDKKGLETYVINCIEHDISSGLFVTAITKQLNQRMRERAAGSDRASLQKELDALKSKKERLLDIYLEAKITKDQFVDRSSELDTRIKGVTIALAGCDDSFGKITEKIARSAFLYYVESAKGMDESTRASVIHALVERITIFPDHIVITYKIKDPTGNPIESNVRSSVALNANSGGVLILLSAIYKVRSYRRLVFRAVDFINYRIEGSAFQ